MDKTKPVTYNVIPFQDRFSDISPQVLEEILEELNDMDYLSKKGEKFRTAFWKLFCKGEFLTKKERR